MKLIFPRPCGMHLIVQRAGIKLTAQLLDASEVVLARATGDVAASYVFPDNDRHHALNVGWSASFDVTPREAAVILDQLGIGARPLGDGTSFECSPIRAIAQSQGDALTAGVTLERPRAAA